MKLRGRFTLALALAALVPISAAAVVTRQVIARRLDIDYKDSRVSARQKLAAEIAQLRRQIGDAAATLAKRDDSLAGQILLELAKSQVH